MVPTVTLPPSFTTRSAPRRVSRRAGLGSAVSPLASQPVVPSDPSIAWGDLTMILSLVASLSSLLRS